MFAFISLRSFTLQVVRKSLLPDQSSAAVGEISDEQKSERTKAVYSIIEQELQSKVSKYMCIFCVRSLNDKSSLSLCFRSQKAFLRSALVALRLSPHDFS